jgi:hypothetical protein
MAESREIAAKPSLAGGYAVAAGSEMLGEQLSDLLLVVDDEDLEPIRWLIGAWHRHC